jgi:membrane protein YqaA with SNARE-associated domain
MLQYCPVSKINSDAQPWLRKWLFPLLALVFVLAISIALFFFGRNPELIAKLKGYGYLGAFLISVTLNATVILGVPALPILCTMGAALFPITGLVGPIMVGVAGGAGAGIGEMTGYGIGYSGRGIVERSRMYKRMEGWVRRWGVLAIFLLSLVPFFFDLVGLAAGVLRIPLWKFVIACWLGRTILYVAFIVLAALGWNMVLPYLG